MKILSFLQADLMIKKRPCFLFSPLAIIVLFLSFANEMNAQKKGYKEYVTEGNYLFMEENYLNAIINFEKAYQLDSTNAYLNFNLGICYLNTLNKKHLAEKHLEVAAKNVNKNCNVDNPMEKTAPPLTHLYYGEALHINYKFDEALQQFSLFEKFISPKDKEWNKIINRDRAIANYAKEQVNVPLNVQIQNLGDSINSEYPEYSPVLTADERMLIYTTRRPNTTGGNKDEFGNYNEDVVVSYKDDNGKWSAPVSISPNINGIGMEASINLSPDGQTLIIYRDGGDGMGGNIYYSTYDGEGWSPLKDFGSDVNTKYWESHACLSLDGNTLIFVSDRPGGYGGRDLYRCVKLPNGLWSKALNMGPVINTEYDEDGAFIHPDGKTFYFTSNGHKTMGGFDIMYATLDENNQFSDVSNMGYPINTTDDDVFYVTSPDGKRGYFSSVKENGFGGKDIYMAFIPEAKERPLALFKGQIIPAAGEKLPVGLVIIVKDKLTGEIVGKYIPKQNNGTFSTILPPGREYTFSYQAPAGNEFYSEDVFVTGDLAYTEIKREVNLEPVKLLGKIKAKGNNLAMNAMVLNNPFDKKPVAGAKIILTDETGNTREFVSDEKGQFSDIDLEIGKVYKVQAEIDGKTSEMGSVNTKDAKPPKVYSQIIYMEKGSKASTVSTPKSTTTSEITLNVTVRDQNRKPYPNANIVLKDNKGNKFEAVTEANGTYFNIPLDGNVYYDLYAESDNKKSSKKSFNTKNIKGKYLVKKILVLNRSASDEDDEDDGGKLVEAEYEFFFMYNKQKIDEEEESWKNFISKADELSKLRTITINVYSSASTVPTRAYKNNKMLASARAKKTVERIAESLQKQGVNMSNVNFKRRSKVTGPPYKGDFENRKKYEPYQFVKAKIY
jgi:hypothetical protein